MGRRRLRVLYAAGSEHAVPNQEWTYVRGVSQERQGSLSRAYSATSEALRTHLQRQLEEIEGWETNILWRPRCGKVRVMGTRTETSSRGKSETPRTLSLILEAAALVLWRSTTILHSAASESFMRQCLTSSHPLGSLPSSSGRYVGVLKRRPLRDGP